MNHGSLLPCVNGPREVSASDTRVYAADFQTIRRVDDPNTAPVDSSVLKLMDPAVIRAADRWRGITVGEFVAAFASRSTISGPAAVSLSLESNFVAQHQVHRSRDYPATFGLDLV